MKTLSVGILVWKLKSTLLQIVFAVDAAPASGLRKVFHGRIILGIRIEEDRFGFEPEVISWVARIGHRICEVGIGDSTACMRRAT